GRDRRRARRRDECHHRRAPPAPRHAAPRHAVPARTGLQRAWPGLAWTEVARWVTSGPHDPADRENTEKEHVMDIKAGRQPIAEATEKLKNWGGWGKDDQIGTLNPVRPEDIIKAAGLIRAGKVFALGIPLDSNGPQTGLFGGRFNPIHQMLATGTDAIAGRQ